LGLGAMYAVHLTLAGKLVVIKLVVIIELFFARCFRFVTMQAFDGQTDRRTACSWLDRVAFNAAR